MKKSILTALGCLLLAAVFPIAAFAQELIVGGQAIGIRIQTEGVLVSGLGEVETAEGSRRPAADAGLQEGDRILQANGRELHSAAELIAAVGEAEGRTVELTIRREEKDLLVFVQPALSKDGQWMMGLWLRDVVTGIGTVTFCDPETGIYGALGHSIRDDTSGCRVDVGAGSITEAEITGVTSGEPGTPGALNGDFTGGRVLGSVEQNGDCGIYGRATAPLGSRTVEVGQFRTGPASILTTVNGREVREFEVRITRSTTPPGATASASRTCWTRRGSRSRRHKRGRLKRPSAREKRRVSGKAGKACGRRAPSRLRTKTGNARIPAELPGSARFAWLPRCGGEKERGRLRFSG